MKQSISQDRVCQLFNYNGRALVWKERPLSDFKDERVQKLINTRLAGKVAGCRNPEGYIQIKVDGRFYKAHRLIFLMRYGYVPKQLDHINGIRDDNRIENLRAADFVTNNRNMKRPANNTTGRIGVYWYKASKKWRALIGVGGKSVHLGHFEKFNEACAARVAAEKKYGFHPNHGRAE